jgi:site-specific recombinase XerD
MSDTVFVRPSVNNRQQLPPGEMYLDELVIVLQQQGYARDTIRGYLHACTQFGQWLGQQGYHVADVDETLIQQYLSGCHRSRTSRQPKAAEGLPHLLRLLRQRAIVPPPRVVVPSTAADHWMRRYEHYLEHVLGAALRTRQRYLPVAAGFLATCMQSESWEWRALRAEDITEFVRQQAALRTGAGRKMPTIVVRSVLRFLVFCGALRPGMEAAAPALRQWTHAPLPHRLTHDEVERVLATCVGTTHHSLRDRVILLLLGRLGVRAHEIVALHLENVDWHHGHLVIRPGKMHHERLLPLSQELGNALALYLRQGRPTSEHRHVFLTLQAPFRPLQGASAITQIAQRTMHRAGIALQPRQGAHTFRHTVASQMVNRGASFKEVADVLGHRSLQTTGIYAKLDLDALARVALPWTGATV